MLLEIDVILLLLSELILLLALIVISKEKVIAQAEEYGHSVKREYAFLIAHSVLHLSGYDHMEEEERIEMDTLQREILNDLNILIMKTKLYTFLLSSLLCTGALADNEPWQNPQVNEMKVSPP